MSIRRMWINQPSKCQPLHHLHGTNVLAVETEDTCRIYFLSGPVICAVVPRLSLSDGWTRGPGAPAAGRAEV